MAAIVTQEKNPSAKDETQQLGRDKRCHTPLLARGWRA